MPKENNATKISDWIIYVVSSRKFRMFVYMWFVFQATYMALSTNLGISPDEIYHYSFIQLFAKNGWLPFIHNQTGYYFLGEVTHTPFFLYNYILSLPYHVIGSSTHSLIILRFINIAFGVLSLYITARIADELKVSKLVKNLSLFILSNTLMFVFLAGMLNYDNLLVLFTLISVYLLLEINNNFNSKYLLELCIVILAGLLTVVNFIPIALFIVLAFIIQNAKNTQKLIIKFLQTWRHSIKLNAFLSVIASLLLILFLQRFAVNIVKYHSLSPACQKVNLQSQCQQSALYVRDQSLKKVVVPPQRVSFVKYTESWTSLMNERTFGIFGHKSVSPTILIAVWSQIFILLGIGALIRLFKTKENKNLSLVILLTFFYSFVLFMNNYIGYRHNGIVSIAVQGRYLFAIYPFLLIILNFYILKLLVKKRSQSLYVCITLLVFITAGLPSYLIKTDPSWYTRSTSNFNQKLHSQLIKIYKLK